VNSPTLVAPATLAEAVGELDALGGDAALLAGGTWVMRAHHRGEPFARAYVSLLKVPELAEATVGERSSLGALLTHDDLAALDRDAGSLGAVAQAARTSAFPAIRGVATLGGNLCATGFREAELSAALLALDAEVEVVSPTGTANLPLDTYLDTRPAGILARAHVPCPAGRRSAYRRLTVLRGSEYPVCGVATSFTLDGSAISRARVVAAAVDARPRLLTAAAEALDGVDAADEAAVLAAGRAGAAELPEHDGLDAPGWYRLAVLPALLRDAVSAAAGSSA
jgi:aerobic carbon-monoxide dehydrogenase medium subunit